MHDIGVANSLEASCIARAATPSLTRLLVRLTIYSSVKVPNEPSYLCAWVAQSRTPTIGSFVTDQLPMNSQWMKPGYLFFLTRTSKADLRDIHVPSSTSPAPPYAEL